MRWPVFSKDWKAGVYSSQGPGFLCSVQDAVGSGMVLQHVDRHENRPPDLDPHRRVLSSRRPVTSCSAAQVSRQDCRQFLSYH